MKNIGVEESIKAVRTQKNLADLLSVKLGESIKQQYISRWLNCDVELTVRTVKAISDVSGVPVSRFFIFEDTEKAA